MGVRVDVLHVHFFVNVEARGQVQVSSSGTLSTSFETETLVGLEHTK